MEENVSQLRRCFTGEQTSPFLLGLVKNRLFTSFPQSFILSREKDGGSYPKKKGAGTLTSDINIMLGLTIRSAKQLLQQVEREKDGDTGRQWGRTPEREVPPGTKNSLSSIEKQRREEKKRERGEKRSSPDSDNGHG